MTRHELRLELLKLAHSHGKTPLQVIEIAEAYEAFALSAGKAETPRQTKVDADLKR